MSNVRQAELIIEVGQVFVRANRVIRGFKHIHIEVSDKHDFFTLAYILSAAGAQAE